jgi:alpha-mannosidase
MNRKLELLYRDAEILQSLMALKTKKWNEGDKDKLHNGWKFILLNQFHDILPGSSITEVYEDTRKEHGIAWNLGFEVYSDALASICGKDETKYGVINTAGWPRAGMVKLPRVKKNTALFCGTQPLVIQDSDYEGAPATYVWTPQIAPLGSVTLQAGKSAGEVSGKKNFSLKKNGIVTPFYAIKWNDQGQIVSLIDRKVKREALCGPGNQLQIFEDRPHNLDAWQIEATIDQKREIISALKSCTVMETGPLFARSRVIWTYGKSKITQDMILYSMHKRIDFKTEVDWQERSKLLKAAFFVDIRATSARYDIQYGSMERSSHKSTGWDEAQFEAPAHQWTDFSEKGFGVSLMNESKYGYDIKGKTMRISLLRAPDFPDIEADRGVQQFTYSIYTHGDPWYASDLIPLAWDLNAPLIAVSGECTMGDLVNLSAPGMALDTVKQSEDGTDLIFRFHELHGGRTKLKLSFNQPVSGYVETDLMEQPLGRYKKNQVITRELQPFEIVTFRVVL